MISLLVPTRGRPASLARMAQSAEGTARADIEFCFYVDEDDPEYNEVFAVALDFGKVMRGPRVVLSECWNKAYQAAEGDILMHASDDIVFHTEGWDLLVRDAFARYPDNIAFVYGRDGFQDEQLGTHGFVHQRWVETVGYFVPPYFSSDFNDLWLHQVAGMIGRRVYLPEVFIEHMHPVAGKGEWDVTHQERLERHERDRPQDLYERLWAERESDAAKLKAQMVDSDRVGSRAEGAAQAAAG